MVKCEIISLERKLFSGDVSCIKLTATADTMEVLDGHTDFLHNIEDDTMVTVVYGGRSSSFQLSKGVLELFEGRCLLLVSAAQPV